MNGQNYLIRSQFFFLNVIINLYHDDVGSQKDPVKVKIYDLGRKVDF